MDKIIEFAAKVPSDECEVFLPPLPHCTNDHGCCGTLVGRTTPPPGVAGIVYLIISSVTIIGDLGLVLLGRAVWFQLKSTAEIQ